MYCIKCGKEIDPTKKFCSFCGAEINQKIAQEPNIQKQPQIIKNEPIKPVVRKTSTKKKKPVMAIIALAVSMVAIIFGVMIFSGKFDKGIEKLSNGELKESNTVVEDVPVGVIDLYEFVEKDEDYIAKCFGVEKNELGMYPTDLKFNIHCTDGKVDLLHLSKTQSEDYNYSVAGIVIDDTEEVAKKKAKDKGFAYVISDEFGGQIFDYFSDKYNYTLLITFESGKAVDINYVNDTIENLTKTVSERDGDSDQSEEETKIQPDYTDIIDQYGNNPDNRMCEYGFYDLDEDGVQELIIGYGSCNADYCNDIYTGDSEGNAVCVGKVYGLYGLYEAEDNDGIYAVHGKMGYETVQRITLVNGKVKEENLWERETEDYYENPNRIEMHSYESQTTSESGNDEGGTIPEYYVYVDAPDGYINLRSGPGTEYEIICPLTNGTALEIYPEEATAQNGKKWAKVAFGAEEGWITGWVIASQLDYGDQASDYILPNSQTSLISESDLQGLSKEECRIARNEIYARHGKIFESEDLQEYFCSKYWYMTDEGFTEDNLSKIEKDNLKVIVAYEEKMGYR